VGEASVKSAEGEKFSDSIGEVAVGWISRKLEEGTSVPMLETSIEEGNELGRSRVEVAPDKSVMLVGKSSDAEILDAIASVVIGDGMNPLRMAVLRAIALVSVLATLVRSIDRVWPSLIIVDVGNKVSDTTSCGTEPVTAMSVGVATEPTKMLVRLPKMSVTLSSGLINVAEAGRVASAGMTEESMVVLGDSVISSCVEIVVESSRMLDNADWSITGAAVKVLSAPSVTERVSKTLVALSASGPTPKLNDTLAVGVASIASSDHVGDGGGI
jgi:hypothetical protein